MEKENVNKIFNYCIDELKYMFMFMNSDQNYHYFKHQLTREYIKIPIWSIDSCYTLNQLRPIK